jgi:hypothetical protein
MRANTLSLGMEPKLLTNLEGIWSILKVGWKMIRMNFSRHASSWKWPTFVGFPRGLFLEPAKERNKPNTGCTYVGRVGVTRIKGLQYQ